MKRLLPLFLLLLPLFAQAAPTCVVGATGVAPKAVLAWTAPTLNTDGSAVSVPLTYNLYQGTSSGSEVKVASGITTLTSSVTTGLLGGKTYFWYVTAVDSLGIEGAASTEVCKQFLNSIPGAVTLTVS